MGSAGPVFLCPPPPQRACEYGPLLLGRSNQKVFGRPQRRLTNLLICIADWPAEKRFGNILVSQITAQFVQMSPFPVTFCAPFSARKFASHPGPERQRMVRIRATVLWPPRTAIVPRFIAPFTGQQGGIPWPSPPSSILQKGGGGAISANCLFRPINLGPSFRSSHSEFLLLLPRGLFSLQPLI